MIRIEQPVVGICEEILRFFPTRLFEHLYEYFSRNAAVSEGLTELHIRKNAILTVVSRGKNFAVKDSLHRYVTVDGEEITEILSSLCAHSVHSYDEEILKGSFALANGLRVGVGGHALYRCGSIRSLREVCCLCIRIPRCVHEISSGLMGMLRGGEVLDAGAAASEGN